MATPDQIRTRGRWSLALLTLLAAFIVVGVAAADQIDADADALATSPPAGNGATANQQPGTTVEYDLSAAIDETGNATDDVFAAAGDNVAVTIARSGSWLASPAGSPASFTFTTYNTNQAGKIRIAVPCGTSAGTVRVMSAVLTAVASNGKTLTGSPVTLTWTITALGADAPSCTPSNSPPTANAGGPYAVDEGGSVGLSGTGSDPDGDPLTYAWDLDSNGSFETAGQNVTFSAAGRDGPDSQTVVLRVCDDESACTTSSTTVSINNLPPTIGSVTNSGPVAEGSPATITVYASDPAGVLDPLSYEFDCDDNSVYEIGPQSGNTAQCTYPDGPSSHAVNVRATDGDGGADTGSTTVSVENVEPTIVISGGSNVDEGSSYSLTLGAVTDPGTDTVTDYTVNWGDGSSDTYGTNGVKTHTYADGPDNHAITVDLTDEDDTFIDQANALSVTVDNVKPSVTIDSLTGTGGVACIGGNSVTLGFSWTDPAGTNDTYAYDVNWGDGSAHATGGNATSPVTGPTHSYAAGGPYTITVTVNDEDPGAGGSANSSSFSFLYSTSGILQPINLTTPRSSFKIGSTIPVKIRVADCNGVAVSGLTLKVKLQKLDSSANPINETVEVSVPDDGDTMRYDSAGKQYIYNLSTKRSYFFGGGDLTPGTYRVTVYNSVIAPASADFDTK